MTDDKFIVKVENGYAKLFDENGNFKGYICGNAVKAEATGGKIRVTTREGKIKTYRLDEIYEKKQ